MRETERERGNKCVYVEKHALFTIEDADQNTATNTRKPIVLKRRKKKTARIRMCIVLSMYWKHMR